MTNSNFEAILPLHDSETTPENIKPEVILEVRKVFARVLLSNDYELMQEALIALDWLNKNRTMLKIIERPVCNCEEIPSKLR